MSGNMSAHRSSKTQIRNASKCQEFWMNKIVRGRELTFRHAAHLKSKYLRRDLRANTNIIICFFPASLSSATTENSDRDSLL